MNVLKNKKIKKIKKTLTELAVVLVIFANKYTMDYKTEKLFRDAVLELLNVRDHLDDQYIFSPYVPSDPSKMKDINETIHAKIENQEIVMLGAFRGMFPRNHVQKHFDGYLKEHEIYLKLFEAFRMMNAGVLEIQDHEKFKRKYDKLRDRFKKLASDMLQSCMISYRRELKQKIRDASHRALVNLKQEGEQKDKKMEDTVFNSEEIAPGCCRVFVRFTDGWETCLNLDNADQLNVCREVLTFNAFVFCNRSTINPESFMNKRFADGTPIGFRDGGQKKTFTVTINGSKQRIRGMPSFERAYFKWMTKNNVVCLRSDGEERERETCVRLMPIVSSMWEFFRPYRTRLDDIRENEEGDDSDAKKKLFAHRGQFERSMMQFISKYCTRGGWAAVKKDKDGTFCVCIYPYQTRKRYKYQSLKLKVVAKILKEDGQLSAANIFKYQSLNLKVKVAKILREDGKLSAAKIFENTNLRTLFVANNIVPLSEGLYVSYNGEPKRVERGIMTQDEKNNRYSMRIEGEQISEYSMCTKLKSYELQYVDDVPDKLPTYIKKQINEFKELKKDSLFRDIYKVRRKPGRKPTFDNLRVNAVNAGCKFVQNKSKKSCRKDTESSKMDERCHRPKNRCLMRKRKR